MLISRAPFRVSFAGGGSDIPSFYEKYGGCVLSTSIRKYCYIALNPQFYKDEITLKYSETEVVKSPDEIRHRIFRQVFKDFGVRGVEVTSIADIPAGTGLGSSSSFTVALLRLLYTYIGKPVSAYKVAKRACEIEINELGNPIGKQDQFAASFGGLKYYEFCPDGFVKVEPIVMHRDSYSELEHSLLMFYTGKLHDANAILAKETASLATESDKIEATKKLCELARELRFELQGNNVYAVGPALLKGWEIKKSLANGISNPLIDEAFARGMNAGASGGKLLGAGGGGFLLFQVKDDATRKAVREAMKDYIEMRFELDQAGCSIIFME